MHKLKREKEINMHKLKRKKLISEHILKTVVTLIIHVHCRDVGTLKDERKNLIPPPRKTSRWFSLCFKDRLYFIYL